MRCFDHNVAVKLREHSRAEEVMLLGGMLGAELFWPTAATPTRVELSRTLNRGRLQQPPRLFKII